MKDIEAMKLAENLRKIFSVQTNISSRSFNAQMKYANKIDAKYIIVLGENELKDNKCRIKCMKTGEELETMLNADEITDKIFEYEEII